MPRFSETGADMYICQVCGRDLDGEKHPSQWRTDITGRESAGNVCPSCVRAYEGQFSSYTFTCRTCKMTKTFNLKSADVQRWRNGELIQRVFPKLSIEDRELMISSTCGQCFDQLFGDE